MPVLRADPHVRVDDGALPDFTSGLMWFATGVGGLAMLLMPGSQRHVHMVIALVLAAFAIGWGSFSIYLGHTEKTMSIRLRAVVTAAMMPLVALALWATGGVSSFLQPVLLFPALFVSYFFPPRLAWPLIAVFVLVFASPLFYDGAAVGHAYPARVLCFAMAVAGEAVAMRFLKHRLLKAEAHQRAMAERDPLTGLYNRRSFDSALETAVPGSAALLVFDFNDFKVINDVWGHPVGDEVLQMVARAGQSVIREGDCLARIGGDEFALLAPGAGSAGAARLVDALDEAIRDADAPVGVGPIRATFGWAVAPEESADPSELFRLADNRLIDRKRALKALELGLRDA